MSLLDRISLSMEAPIAAYNAVLDKFEFLTSKNGALQVFISGSNEVGMAQNPYEENITLVAGSVETINLDGYDTVFLSTSGLGVGESVALEVGEGSIWNAMEPVDMSTRAGYAATAIVADGAYRFNIPGAGSVRLTFAGSASKTVNLKAFQQNATLSVS